MVVTLSFHNLWEFDTVTNEIIIFEFLFAFFYAFFDIISSSLLRSANVFTRSPAWNYPCVR